MIADAAVLVFDTIVLWLAFGALCGYLWKTREKAKS